MMRKTIFLLAVAILGWGAGQPLASSVKQSNSVTAKEYRQTPPPIGYVAYCARNPVDCRAEETVVRPLDLTAERWALLIKVNSAVNAAIAPINDQDLYGEPEYWTVATDAGDCEDILLLKRRILHASGFPMQSLRITVVLDETGAGHAVLTVTTSQGDYVLDNRRNDIRLWGDTGYKFLKRQSARDPNLWVSLVKDEAVARRSIQVGSDR